MSINKIFNLTNKVIILTGASGLLGTEYAHGLSQAGANVVLADLNFEKCKKLSSNINEKYGVDSFPIKLDVTKTNSINTMIKKVIKKFSKIDILINNAIFSEVGNTKTTFENYDLNIWKKGLNVNLTGPFLCCQEVGKIMKKQKNGNIINISSVYGLLGADQRIYEKSGWNSTIAYGTTKSAILNMTRYLASYWHNAGIRVNSLSLGGVERGQGRKFVKKYSEKTMIGRMAKQDEYVGAIIFLSSNSSSYMTGSNLVIDGGWTAW